MEEVKIHSSLVHPSIVQFYSSFEDKKYVYIVLELAELGDLERYMKQRSQQLFSEGEGETIYTNKIVYLRYYFQILLQISVKRALN